MNKPLQFYEIAWALPGAGKEGQFKSDGIRQREGLILTPVISKRQGRGKIAVSFCLLHLFSPVQKK